MSLRTTAGENLIPPDSARSNTEIVALFVLLAIYAWVGFSSLGYDNEFTNIVLVEHNKVGAVLHIVNTTDVHPPGSYLINWALFRLLHEWRLVRLVTALFEAVLPPTTIAPLRAALACQTRATMLTRPDALLRRLPPRGPLAAAWWCSGPVFGA
jgi:hypothetical protein